MTQKEKLMKANLFAFRMKSIAKAMHFDGNDYGIQCLKEHAKEIDRLANEIIGILK